jgi:hypothetical protein
VTLSLAQTSYKVGVQVLFICGSLDQTTQMHAVARALSQQGSVEARFTPVYCDGLAEQLRRLGLMEYTIVGQSWRNTCLRYLQSQGLVLDPGGQGGDYDLVVTCTDLFVPANVRGRRLVLVQEGMTDPESFGYRLQRMLPFLPLWLGGAGATGLSDLYDRFCVASAGYRDLFVKKGVRPEKVVVTGIPNFDDCDRFRRNAFPHRDYVLVCTSDTREPWNREDRRALIAYALAVAAGRQLIFKLHPNEPAERSRREIREQAPRALVYTAGSAEQMVANCAALIVQYSTLAYVGVALGKEVHAYTELADLRRLTPLQGGGAARNIAEVCRDLVGEPRDSLRLAVAS